LHQRTEHFLALPERLLGPLTAHFVPRAH
jgi:hypothetical protein